MTEAHDKDDATADAATLGLKGIDLQPLLHYAQAAINQVLGPLLAGRAESVQIMRKHILRSEAELLRGLLAVVEKEEQRAESGPKERRPQRVPVE
jgi:hypothetical protein